MDCLTNQVYNENSSKDKKVDNLIVLLGEFSSDVVEVIKSELPNGFSLIHDKELKFVKDAKYIVIGGGASITGSLLENAKQLRLIQKWGIGVDKIDIDAATIEHIPVAITAGQNADVVAEHAVLLMLALYRHLPFVHNELRAGRWLRKEMRSISFMIRDKIIGIIGFGNIGRSVAKKLQGFGATIHYYDIARLSQESEKKLNIKFCELDTLLSTSDIVTLHLPLNDETRNLIDSERLSLMKTSSIIVNTARGELIDESALYEALKNGGIWGAGLDVFSVEPPFGSPLISLDNVILTPHIGGSAFDNVANVARHCFKNIELISQGLSIPKQDLINLRGE